MRTSFHHQPEAQHPNFPLSVSWQADYPIFWHESADSERPLFGCFSNRPFRVKRFQTIHDCGVNVARGLALLSGLGTKALPSWVSKTRWNNLSGDLAVNVTAGSSGRTNSPHPSSREGHHSTARWSSSVLLLD